MMCTQHLFVALSMQGSINITGDDSLLSAGIVTNYKIYVNSRLKVAELACVDEECEYVVDLSAASCPRSSIISISVSATNTIGESPANPLIIGMQILRNKLRS